MNRDDQNNETGAGASPWLPLRYLAPVDPLEAALSKGFLRCRPEKWFPGIAAHWLPLAHSLGLNLKLQEVKPLFSCPPLPNDVYIGSVDGEPIVVFFDLEHSQALLDAIVPNAQAAAREIVAEYLARRLISSLAASWSGPESSVVHFDSEGKAQEIQGIASIRVSVEVNSTPVVAWIVIGQQLAERLDGLWRRQMRPVNKGPAEQHAVTVELAELAVAPTEIGEYLNNGATIDLEIPVSEHVTLRLDGKSWLPGRMCSVNGKFGIEVMPGQAPAFSLPDGTTRISVELFTLTLDKQQVAELSQVGAIWDTSQPLGSRVGLVINSERVAEGVLYNFQGRFAVTIG